MCVCVGGGGGVVLSFNQLKIMTNQSYTNIQSINMKMIIFRHFLQLNLQKLTAIYIPATKLVEINSPKLNTLDIMNRICFEFNFA